MSAARIIFRCASRRVPASALSAQASQPTHRLHIRSYASVQTGGGSKSVIVTGSARGIGQAVAFRLASDGYDVCVNDVAQNRSGINETVAQIKSMGRRSCGVEADVTDYSQVEHLVETSVKELGPLRTMVANAGIVQVKQLLQLDEADFERMFRVNVFGVQNSFKVAAQQMIRQGDAVRDHPGKLIAASSIAAFKPFGLLAHYCAAKAAVVGLCRSYAVELAEHNITCNNYAPGIVGTPMWDLIDAEIGRMRGATLGQAVKQGDVMKQYSREMISLGRTSVPQDVAGGVSFLASRDSDYMTGQTQVLDGGIIFR